MAAFAIAEPRFLSPLNLFNVMRQVSIDGLLAIGMTFVILTAGIDLSVGSLLAFAGLVAAAVSPRAACQPLHRRRRPGRARLWLVSRGARGDRRRPCRRLLQGFAITRLKVPPFVVTLGGMSAFRGAALLFAAGGPISGFDPIFVWWGQGRIFGQVPVPGRSSSSSSPCSPISCCATPATAGRSTRSAAIRRRRGCPASTSARVITQRLRHHGLLRRARRLRARARLNSAEAVAGTGYELTVIASVVIGGTSLFGGVGTIFGTVIGTILIGVLLNGLVLMNVSSYIQQIIIGVIIVLAVAFDTFAKSRRRTG